MLQGTGNATAGAITGEGNRTPREPSAMIDVEGVAGLLDCSTRHVYRLADMGRMPRPVKLGALVRWSRATVLDWIAQGCPSCRSGGAR
jgi:excisionase family DNA binding protein